MKTTRWTILVLLVTAVTAAAQIAPVGNGDFEFFLDTAVFRNADGTTRTEVYLRVPNSGVRFREEGSGLEARIRLSFRILDGNGEEAASDSRELTMVAADAKSAASPLHFQTLTRTFALEPGSYALSCAVEDLNSPKITVVGLIRHDYKTSTVHEYPLEVPVFPTDRMSMSDPKFLWSTRGAGSPNPSRMYGVYKDSLSTYAEIYVPADMAARTVKIETIILDELGETVTESELLVPPGGDTREPVVTLPLRMTEDLNRFAAGKYTLYVNAGFEDQLLLRARAGYFNVAWDMRTWEVTRRSYTEEARFLMEGDDFDAFVKQEVGEQEAMLAEMWAEIDPDPTTGVNEAYEEFLVRLDYVNTNFTDYQLGIFTDRGLIYLKYGPPDEKIFDVVPPNRESLADAMQKVQDKYHPVDFASSPGRVGNYKKPIRDPVADPRRISAVGEGGNEGYPYELWIYNGPGQPLLERDRSLESDIGLRFIFVDREGFGRYRLESSSSMSNK